MGIRYNIVPTKVNLEEIEEIQKFVLVIRLSLEIIILLLMQNRLQMILNAL